MSNTHRTHGLRDLLRFLPAATVVVLVAALWLSASAQAAYEQLPGANGIFGGTAAEVKEGKFAEEAQLGGAGAMAVNRTGAGGVPKGTLYAVTETLGVADRVAMYEPKAGGGMEFVEGWNVVRLDKEFERCGPLLGTEVVEGKEVAEHPCPTRQTGSVNQQPVGLDVDQSTGYVYVYSNSLRFDAGGGVPADTKLVVVYNADASEVITRFGEVAAGETVAESPGKTHAPGFASDMLAVKGAGEVYVFDGTSPGENFYRRLMVFRPHDGDYKDYEYVGEVAGTSQGLSDPQAPVFDEAGNLYVASFIGNSISELPAETPGAYPNLALSPRCKAKINAGGVLGMTVDPKTGEPFYFSEKFPPRIRRLGPCDEATHEFKVEGQGGEELALSPEPEYVYALAVDPTREIGETRRDGALYAASAGPNIGTTGHSALGYIFAHPKQLPPVIEGQSIGHVTATSAVACATVNPNGYRTHYAFQYLSEAEYQEAGESFAGAKEAPLGGGDLEGTGGVQRACVALGPLVPEGAYRFRAVVASQCIELSEEPCTDEGDAFPFSTYPATVPTLPDGRAWEMVSPAMKNGGQVWPSEPGISTPGSAKPGGFNTSFARQVSPDGEAVAYQGSAFGDGGTVTGNEYVARRDPVTGWQTTSFTPTLLSGRYLGFDTSLGNGILEQEGGVLTPDAPLGFRNFYSQPTDGSPELTPLITAEPAHRKGSQFEINYAGASTDQSRVFFSANDALTEATEFAPASADGGKAKFNLYEWHEGNLALVNVKPGNTEAKAGASFEIPSANPISKDGTRAFWSDEKGQVYMREAGQSTKVIATEGVPDPGNFLVAAKDGSAVLLANGHLHYTQGAEETVDLTEGLGGFVGAIGQADDLSHVYFVDTKVLDAVPNGEGEAAEAGASNLYAWQAGGSARFVGRLGGKEATFPDSSDWVASPNQRTAEASPNGRFVTFISNAQLTGYDNIGPCKFISVSQTVPAHYVAGPCTEAFLYDSQTGRLVCASCNPSGAAPLGFSILRRARFDQPRYLTDAGRLFFDSEDSLSPLDTNEGVEDVYEFEPQGVGSCEKEDGCVSLISAGREAIDSNFVGMGEDGRDVFFTTRDRLVGKDTDELVDLYDARIGGGIAAESETQRGECQGEACQPPPVIPNHPTPATSAPAGEGNVKEGGSGSKRGRCAKGRTRSHGRCVKPQAHKKKAKKSHNKQGRTNNDRGAK